MSDNALYFRRFMASLLLLHSLRPAHFRPVASVSVEQIVSAAAQDFDAFYAQPCPEEVQQQAATPMQVLHFDAVRGDASRGAASVHASTAPMAPKRLWLHRQDYVQSQTDGDRGGHLPHRPSCAQSANGGAVCPAAPGAPRPPLPPRLLLKEALGESGKLMNRRGVLRLCRRWATARPHAPGRLVVLVDGDLAQIAGYRASCCAWGSAS